MSLYVFFLEEPIEANLGLIQGVRITIVYNDSTALYDARIYSA
jgi:hypothetical protein